MIKKRFLILPTLLLPTISLMPISLMEKDKSIDWKQIDINSGSSFNSKPILNEDLNITTDILKKYKYYLDNFSKDIREIWKYDDLNNFKNDYESIILSSNKNISKEKLKKLYEKELKTYKNFNNDKDFSKGFSIPSETSGGNLIYAQLMIKEVYIPIWDEIHSNSNLIQLKYDKKYQVKWKKYSDFKMFIECQKRKIAYRVNKFVNKKEISGKTSSGGYSKFIDLYGTKIFEDFVDYSKYYINNYYYLNDKGQKIYSKLFKSNVIIDLSKILLNTLVDTKLYAFGTQQYVNWWQYEIGAPKRLLTILNNLKNGFNEKELKKFMTGYNYFDSDPLYNHSSPTSINGAKPQTKKKAYGANLLDNCLIFIKSSIILRNQNKIKETVKKIYENVFSKYVELGDGFYKDGSFIQHGHIPYMGSYGEVLFSSFTNIYDLLKKTKLDIFLIEPKFQKIFEFIHKSVEPFYYQGVLSPSLGGRSVSRKINWRKLDFLNNIAKLLERASDKEKVTNFLRRNIQQSIEFGLNKNKLPFYLKKYTNGKYTNINRTINTKTQNRLVLNYDNWMTTISFKSSNISGFESILGENLQGFYQGDGMILTHTQNNPNPFSYDFWWGIDPYQLPGVTADESNYLKIKSSESFSAGNDPWRKYIDNNPSKPQADSIFEQISYKNITIVRNSFKNYMKTIKNDRAYFVLGDKVIVLGSVNKLNKKSNFISTTIDNRISNNKNTTYKQIKANNNYLYIYKGKYNEKIGYIIFGEKGNISKKKYDRNAILTNRTIKSESTVNSMFNRLWIKNKSNYAFGILPNDINENKIKKTESKLKIVWNKDGIRGINYIDDKDNEFILFSNTSNYLDETDISIRDIHNNIVKLKIQDKKFYIFKKDKITKKWIEVLN